MEVTLLKDKLRALAVEAIEWASGIGFPPQIFAPKAFYSEPPWDGPITGRASFKDAVAAVGAVPKVVERYGDERAWRRLVLDFVHGFIERLPSMTFDDEIFETAWHDYEKELSAPGWVWIGLAQLQNFRSEEARLNLGDGVSIVSAPSSEELVGMGWSESQIDQLVDERSNAPVSGHVLMAETVVPKAPINFGANELEPFNTSHRALLALRLLKGGELYMGHMIFLLRRSFPLGFPHIFAIGDRLRLETGGGAEYVLREHELPAVRDLCGVLRRHDQGQPDRAPVNLDLALRAFSDSYDRYSFGRFDTQLLSLVTAAEALLGTNAETTFRLAFRIASILASDDDERTTLYRQIKTYYDTRSRVVHGERLKTKHEESLQNLEAFQDAVRRLIVGFLRLTDTAPSPYGKTYFKERLDETLLHSGERSALRCAMGLEQ
jgi:hypothetical protein